MCACSTWGYNYKAGSCLGAVTMTETHIPRGSESLSCRAPTLSPGGELGGRTPRLPPVCHLKPPSPPKRELQNVKISPTTLGDLYIQSISEQTRCLFHTFPEKRERVCKDV